MKRLIATLLAALCLAGPALASSEGPAWDKFPKERMNDMAALQNGAKLFVNYCLNCHSAAYMRYNRMRDIGLTDDQIKKNLLFASEKVGDLMTVSLNPKEAKEWFGAVPPDLSVIARSRAGAQGSGADYLYTYMRTFYRDETRPTGWNNLVFPAVGMPHVLWELQGEQRAVYAEQEDPHDKTKKVHVFKGFEQTKPGAMSKADYDNATADLVAFLQWMGEPAQNSRVRLGVLVMIFLAVFTVITWRLNAAYWKDIK
ncbi:MAG: cytochrome c1 [Burkholderiaceae bacterium]|jgi:ubiquinol-cytochrome c reductase cytochrome c1 subunit|nr:cytochrome c1 [Aquabacterium sp.]NUP86818.1 cytochrome c1 [Burkholderiaceae bacterium]